MIVQETERTFRFTYIRKPVAWRLIWATRLESLPLWALSAVLLFEMAVISALRLERSFAEFLYSLAAVAGILSFPVALQLWAAFWRPPSRLGLELDAEGIKTLDQTRIAIPWDRVGRLVLRKFPAAPGAPSLNLPIPGLGRLLIDPCSLIWIASRSALREMVVAGMFLGQALGADAVFRRKTARLSFHPHYGDSAESRAEVLPPLRRRLPQANFPTGSRKHL